MKSVATFSRTLNKFQNEKQIVKTLKIGQDIQILTHISVSTAQKEYYVCP